MLETCSDETSTLSYSVLYKKNRPYSGDIEEHSRASKNWVRKNCPGEKTMFFSKSHKIVKNHPKNMKKYSKESSNDKLWEKIIFIVFGWFFCDILKKLC